MSVPWSVPLRYVYFSCFLLVHAVCVTSREALLRSQERTVIFHHSLANVTSFIRPLWLCSVLGVLLMKQTSGRHYPVEHCMVSIIYMMEPN